MDLQARIELLERENALLEARVAALMEALAPETPLPVEWRLTATEASVMRVLLARDLATKGAVMAALYGVRASEEDEPDPKIVDVYIHKLRRKLVPFGVVIETSWGQGYALKNRAQWRARIDGPGVAAAAAE